MSDEVVPRLNEEPPADTGDERRRRRQHDHRVTFFKDFAYKARFSIVTIPLAVVLRLIGTHFCWLDSRSGWTQGMTFWIVMLVGATAYNLWGFSRAKDAAYTRYRLHALSIVTAILAFWLVFVCDSVVAIQPEMINVDPAVKTACEQNLAPGMPREQCYCLYDLRPAFWNGSACVVDTQQFPHEQ